MKTLMRCIEWLSSRAGDASAWIVLLMTLSVCYDVIARYVFNAAQPWGMQSEEWALVFLVYFGAAWTLKEEGHISIDFITSKLKPKANVVVTKMVGSFISLIYVSVLIWQSSVVVQRSFVGQTGTGGVVEFPIFVVQSIVPLGASLLWLQFCHRIYNAVRQVRHGGMA